MSDGNPTLLCLRIHSGSFGSEPFDFLLHVGFQSPFPLHLLYFGELWERFGPEPTSLLFACLYPLWTPKYTLTHTCTEIQFTQSYGDECVVLQVPAQLLWSL